MGSMSFNAEMLTTEGYEEFNLTLISGTIGDFLSSAIDMDIESFPEYWEDETGQELPSNWFDWVTWDWDGAYSEYASGLPDMLTEAYPDLFSTEENSPVPVIVGEVTEAHTRDSGGWGREYVTAPVKINGHALKLMADDNGVSSIHDGDGIDGFIRTAEDSYWSQIQVITQIMSNLDDNSDSFRGVAEDYAMSDSWVENHIDYGKWLKEL